MAILTFGGDYGGPELPFLTCVCGYGGSALAIFNFGLSWRFLTFGVDYGGSEKAILPFDGNYGGSELATLTFGSD